MKLKKLMKRLVALGLAAALIAGDIPITANAASDQEIWIKDGTEETYESDLVGETYISDSNTINGWKDLFKASSTEYAGAVWTDKAVFTNDSSTTAIPDDFTNLDKAVVEMSGDSVVVDGNGNISMTTEENAYDTTIADENFLVAMSALGSTKQIVGYSALPSDTVFILDLSNSMSNDALSKMVEATNKAIQKLLAVNNYNRIGVVVYDTDTSTLLEIDRYTTTETAKDSDGKSYPVYIELINNYDQIVTARTIKEETAYPTANTISNLDSIVNGIPERGRYEDGKDYRRKVAQYLEEKLSTSVVGIDIDWNEELRDENVNEYEDWNNNEWKAWIEAEIKEAESTPVVVSTSVSSIKDSDGNGVDVSVNVGGATYIQGGLNSALNLFKKIYDNNDTAIDTGLIQGGTARIPIAVLMTDGAPTYATTDYTNATNSSTKIGNGSSTNDSMVFPTQLTAAYLRQKMEEYYGRDALFYTLGLGNVNTQALSVLNPYNNTTTNLNTLWTNYENTAKGSTIQGFDYDNRKITRQEDTTHSLTTDRYYVDQYFPASKTSDLVSAFDSIVEAIIIQSKYYPTLVESNAHDFDGYLTFEDEIGEFMEVKDVKGIVLGDTIFTGEAFLTALNESDAFGDASEWTAYGEELLKSISERLDIQENEARTLLAAAYRSGGVDESGNPINQTGQLWTENYIGWYADASGKYLGHWDDEIHTEANYPEGAVYLNKSYIFQGDLSGSGTSVAGGDMMHIIVLVQEEITTGRQSVIWKIPANLIPLVTYDVTVDSNSLDTAKDISVEMKTEEPIRLLFEVGLDESINAVNMSSVVGASDHSHPVKELVDGTMQTVGYAFYSNRWGAGHTPDGSGDTDVLDPTSKLATVSHFHPSEQNERYYYAEDTLIYQKVGDSYELYKGDTKPTGDDYYHIYRIIESAGTGYKVTNKFAPIAGSVLAAEGELAIQQIADADNVNKGAWYIPAGQIYQQIARHQQTKDENITQTLEYYDYPVIVNDADTGYNIYDFLGNNGRLVKYFEEGIKLTKTIDDKTEAGTVEFTFEVAFDGWTKMKNELVLHDADGNALTGDDLKDKLSISGTTATVKIKNGETVYLTGMPVGTKYTVSEVITRSTGYNATDYTVDDNYAVKDVVYNGTSAEITSSSSKSDNEITMTSTTPTYTIAQYTIDEVEFINTKSSHKGDLEITKLVSHPYGDDYVLPDDLTFEVVITLTEDEEGTKPLAEQEFEATGTVNNGEAVSSTLETDEEGQITLQFGHEDSITLKGIPEGANYTITENLAENSPWSISEDDSTALKGTIISDNLSEESIVNTLTVTPADSADINLKIKKEISGTTWVEGWTFDFIVERYDVEQKTWTNILGNETFTVTSKATEINVAGKENGTPRVQFPNVGEYYYRITEVVPTDGIDGITYDTTHRYFYFNVTDENMDGQLEVEAKNYYGTTVTTSGNTTTIAATFTNYYAQAVAEISLEKKLVNDTGVVIPMSDFEFEFCTADHSSSGTCPNSGAHLTLKPTVEGKLTFPVNYTKNQLDSITTWTKDGETFTEGEGVVIPAGATKSKSFEYYLWEKDAAKAGMDYDDTVYKVVVEVTVTKGEGASDTIEVTSTTITNVGTGETEDIAKFSNTFTLKKDLSVPIKIEKTLEGHKIDDKGFTFNVYKTAANFSTAGVTPTTVTVTGDGTQSTASTTAELLTDAEKKAGTYYYVIQEKTGENAAITYDAKTYYVTVEIAQGTGDKADSLVINKVTVNERGGAIVTHGSAASTANITLSFTNTYNIIKNAEVVISGDKDLNGKALTADEFTFGLYEDAECTKAVLDADNQPIVAKSLTVSGAFTFDTLTFNETGDYTYYVKEVVPTGTEKNSHITYDESVYQVVINVTDETADGALEAKTTITKVGAEGETAIKFTNTYTPDPVSVSFTGEKQYVDEDNNKIAIADWPEGGFDFEMYVADSNFNITNDLAATVSAGNEFTGTYTVTEANGVEFVGSEKAIANTSTTEAPFKLNLTFPSAGSYYYILKEVVGDEASLEYDAKEYHVTVIVTDYTGSGILVPAVSVVYNGQSANLKDDQPDATFKNMLVNQTVDVRVQVTKNLLNSSSVTLSLNNFKFGLYKDAECTDLVKESTAASNQDASFNFQYSNKELANGKDYTETYYLKEIIPADGSKLAGVTYDQSVYKVVITVGYDEEGVLEGYDTITQIVDAQGNLIAEADQVVDEDNNATFENGYDITDAKFSISGTKTLVGKNIADGEFTFALYAATVSTDADGNLTGWTTGDQVGESVTNVGGTFSFPEIAYDAEGSQYYVVKEVTATPDDNIIYDASEYLVEVNVVNGGKGAFVATSNVVAKRVAADGAEPAWEYTWATAAKPLSLAFTNEYKADPITVEITGTKTLSGERKDASGAAKGVQDGEFSFELYETGNDYEIADNAKPIKTVSNGVNGIFKFVAETAEGGAAVTTDRLYFATEGTRYYVIKEVPGNDPTITYNSTEYNVKVEVTHNSETGKLEQKVTAVATGNSSVTINNIYTAKTATASVPIYKNLINETGIDYSRTNFSFGVYTDSTCTKAYTGNDVTVSGTDSYGHAKVTFNYTDHDYSTADGAENKYIYYIKENVPTPADSRITYDTAVYKVEVALSYKDGELVATPTITNVASGATVSTATFTNTFSLGSVAVDITGAKNYNNWGTNGDNAQFVMQLYKTDATGNFATGTLIAQQTVTKDSVDAAFKFTSEGATPQTDDALTSELSFSSTGTYYFVVREYNGGRTDTDADIIYDGSQYVVKVEVDANSAQTALVAKTTVEKFAHSSDNVTAGTPGTGSVTATIPDITNVHYEEALEVSIVGKKKMEGRDLVDLEFDFDLYKADDEWNTESTPYISAMNRTVKDEDYNIELTVPLEAADENTEHYFVLKEVDSGNPTITYDATEYRIKIDTEIKTEGSGENAKSVVSVKAVEVFKVEDGVSTKINHAWDETSKQISLFNSTDEFTFVNQYEEKSTKAGTDAIIPVDKQLTNETGVTTVTVEGFKFGLYKDADCKEAVKATVATEDGENVYTPVLDGDGTAVEIISDKDGNAEFQLRFTDKHHDAAKDNQYTYTYYVKEVAGDKAGMTYDGTVYRVDIALQYVLVNGVYELKATPTISEVSANGVSTQASVEKAQFSNSYELEPAEVVLDGVKELDGKDAFKSNYIFDLYKATEEWKIDTSAAPITARNDYKADDSDESHDYDKFVFAGLTFDEAGTYQYIVKERAGELGGVTYDDSEYRVTIEVVADDADETDDDHDGKMNDLVASVSIVKAGDKDATDEIVFNNTYVPTGDFTIEGSKVIIGRDWRESDSFEFQLFETEDDYKVAKDAEPVAKATVTGKDDDTVFTFEDVAISGAGKHYFVLREVEGDADCMEYDEYEYKFVVEATDNLDGTLTVDEHKLSEKTFNFYNEYLTDEVSVDIEGTKALTPSVGNREIQNKEFYFALYNAVVTLDDNGNITKWVTSDQVGEAVPNKGTGFTFEDLTFDQEGEYYFTVKEVAGENPIVTYDTTEHKIKVVVTDIGDQGLIKNGKADLEAEVFYIDAAGNEAGLTDQITFNNKYNDTKVSIAIEKAVTCTGDMEYGLDGFEFQVKNLTTGTVYDSKAVTGSEGNTSFTILYDERDIGKTYEYEITEVDTGIKDMDYDTTVYKLKVTLEVVDGQLVANTVLNDKDVDDVNVTFTNTYNGKTPDDPKPSEPTKPESPTTDNLPKTGDATGVVLWLTVAVASALYIGMWLLKRRKMISKK